MASSDGCRLLRASNPWDCAAWSRALPPPDAGAADLSWRIARQLYLWPDPTPLHLHPAEERRQRLIDVVAGYPELPGGGHPFDQPFHSDAADALELALALDEWPPLAGRGSLRAEILWLDRVRRARIPPPELSLSDAEWLALVIAWLVAGLTMRSPGVVVADLILFDLLYDPEVRDGAVARVEEGRRHLVEAAARRANTGEFPVDFARVDRNGTSLGHRVERLWWGRWEQPLPLKGRGLVPPPPVMDGSCDEIEIRFHRIQSWMFGTTTGMVPLAAGEEGRNSAVIGIPGAVQRGASHLLEGILSGIRRALLEVLGAGNLLVDGGGRLRFRCALDADERDRLDQLVCETIDGLFCPTGALGRRFAGVLRTLDEQGHFGPDGPDPQRLRQLAWAVLPPVSIVFRQGDAGDAAGERRSLPIRRRWRVAGFPDVSPVAGSPKAFIRADRQMSLPMRVRMEIGVLAPRERLLHVRFARGIPPEGAARLPRSTDPFEHLLLADLNRIGELLGRCRGSGAIDREALARRSFRFTAHWLLAVTRTAVELDEPGMPEVLVLGGDDLLVGTRLASGELLSFANRLHERLERLNLELPACDGVSFCAGLVRRGGAPRTGSLLLAEAVHLEEVAKRHWKREVLAAAVPAEPYGSSPVENRIGSGRRMSLILAGAVTGDLPTGNTAGADRRSADLPVEIAVASNRFRLSGLVRWDALDEALRAMGSRGDATERIEVVVEEDSRRAFVVRLAPRAHLLDLPIPDTAPAPCCLRSGSGSV